MSKDKLIAEMHEAILECHKYNKMVTDVTCSDREFYEHFKKIKKLIEYLEKNPKTK